MSDPQYSHAARPEVAFMLAQIGAHAAAKFAERLDPLKFTPPQAGILGVISRQNGLSQQALADLLGMFPSRLVLLLEEKKPCRQSRVSLINMRTRCARH